MSLTEAVEAVLDLGTDADAGERDNALCDLRFELDRVRKASRITFAEHTLGEVIGIAIGMGLPVPPRHRVLRGDLESLIQRAHTEQRIREAVANAGPGEMARQAALLRMPSR